MALRFFFDLNNGTTANWNRVLSATNLTTVVDHTGATASGVGLTVPTTTMYNSSVGGGMGGGTTSGDAAWVTPASHFSDRLQLASTTTWLDFVVTGLNNSLLYQIDVFGWLGGSSSRYLEVRVNGGTPQNMNVLNNLTNDLTFIAAPSSGSITISFRRHTSGAGDAYAQCFQLTEYTTPASMTITTNGGEIVAGAACNVLCEDFSAAPDDETFSINSLKDGIVQISTPVAVTVTDNLDGTYDLDFTAPALPTSGSSSGPLFTDASAGITHTISIGTV